MRSSIIDRSSAMTVAMIAGLAAPAAALAQHASDIIVKAEGGAIVTGRIENKQPVFPRSVYVSELGEAGIPNFALEPGFDSEPGALPAGAHVGIAIRRALREWDGAGFTLIPGLQMRITKDSNAATTPVTDPHDCRGESLLIGAASPSGVLHQHPAYELLTPATEGIYLLEIEVWMGEPGSGVSEPAYILFGQEVTHEELEEAEEWLDARRGTPCYANCDDSTASPILNVADFTCFLGLFAAGDCRANCDKSTATPTLNVADFTCFLSRFADGCP